MKVCGTCNKGLVACRCGGEFTWFPERGYGTLYSAHAFPYDQSYFENFDKISTTQKGAHLNTDRIGLTHKWHGTAPLVDVGIGSGEFIKMRSAETLGYDVAETPKQWLFRMGLWFDPFEDEIAGASFWDSIEHMFITDAISILRNITGTVFISTPIYESAEHVLRSKHFKPMEHLLYFTERGLIGWMAEQGWVLCERNRMEERYGREGIGTFVFARNP